MAVGYPVAVGARGGAVIQALRPARARLITATLAVGLLGGVALYAARSAGSLGVLAAAAGAVAICVLAAGLVLRWPATIPWAILLAGGAYLSARAGHDVVDGWSGVVGVALLGCAELASWSIDHDARLRAERAQVARRVARLALLCTAALFVNVIVVATSAVSAPAGLLLAAVGVAAAVVAVALVVKLVRASP